MCLHVGGIQRSNSSIVLKIESIMGFFDARSPTGLKFTK